MANTFGSATSSVFSARHTLWCSASFGIITAAVWMPAMLNAFVGAIQVTLIFLHVSEAAANGKYPVPGRVISQWISSDRTVT